MPRLSNQESRGFTHVFKFNYADLNTTGYLSSGQKVVGVIPAGAILTNAALVVNTAAAGATDITVGVDTTSGAPTEFILAATDLDALTKVAFNTGTAIDTEPGYANNTTSPVSIYAKFGGTIASLTAGEWMLAFEILDPGNLANNA